MRTVIGIQAAAAIALICSGGLQARKPTALPAKAQYVAMGSSFAAGSGILPSADTPANRCGRAMDNYAHQLARKRDLTLTDVSCGGATTTNILAKWVELPPQIDALTPETRLVTITIGGNDIGYIGGLMMASCRGTATTTCPTMRKASDQDWAALEERMGRIVQEIHRRSPNARVIVIDYPAVLPEKGSCAVTPLSAEDAAQGRETADRLAALTARTAKANGAELVQASKLSIGHDACSAQPWTTGLSQPQQGAPYHPNKAAMTAIAEALDRLLG